ncbi:hypothetical protein HNQ71_005057 [Mesorhizobium sangaii]|uniref:Uncharacterized protein n=1 Tax=Mesorhizobium sangaii TaxID=505389 RepID=A0A841PAZ1_9HYPH|nr:hypothetical protein [Mesorhizobium sangaii]
MQHGCGPLRGHQARGYQARIALARRSAASRGQTAELTRTAGSGYANSENATQCAWRRGA